MTEVEWASCTEPQAMLRFVSDRASDRKLRLFSCACCRKVWHLLPHDWSRQAFEAVEQYLEGSITAEEAAEAWGRQEDGFRAINESRSIENRTEVAADATLAVSWASLPLNPEEPEEERADSRRRPLLAAEQAMHYAGAAESHELYRTQRGFNKELTRRMFEQLSTLLRDIFGPLPFREVHIDPSLLTKQGGLVTKLARAVYENRSLPAGTLDEARLLVLADALEDAGLTDAAVLAHLRSDRPHVRGCWAIDAILSQK